MAVSFTPSNEFLNLATAIDLTSSPQLLLTNSSTYTASDNLTTVATEEVSGFDNFDYSRRSVFFDDWGILLAERNYGFATIDDVLIKLL
jgi:hypothetical protein